MSRPPGALSIDEVLNAARARLTRLSPIDACRAVTRQAVLVDIRPQAQRLAEGDIPGAMVVERNVLEWRFDPASTARLPAASYDLQVIVVCSEGYTSSLAAASLQDLGIWRTTDVVGGFRAWQAAGLPVALGSLPVPVADLPVAGAGSPANAAALPSDQRQLDSV